MCSAETTPASATALCALLLTADAHTRAAGFPDIETADRLFTLFAVQLQERVRQAVLSDRSDRRAVRCLRLMLRTLCLLCARVGRTAVLLWVNRLISSAGGGGAGGGGGSGGDDSNLSYAIILYCLLC